MIEDKQDAGCTAHVMRTKYYAVSTDKLTELMTAAGFQHVRRLDNRFFQPVLVGLRQ